MTKKDNFPIAPDIPEQFRIALSSLSSTWKRISRDSIEFDDKVKEHWKDLIHEWVENKNLPLLIRNSRDGRGKALIHHDTNRQLVLCDNAPAKWIAEKVLLKEELALEDVQKLLIQNNFPTAFVLKNTEKENKYAFKSKNVLNKNGWKLCHIENIGLKSHKRIEKQDINILKKHFINFMNPENFLLLPKKIGALGEISSFLSGFKASS